MSSKIPYKVLKSDLKFLFSSEITEHVNKVNTQKIIKTKLIDIVPQKQSFWSGEQLIEIKKQDLPFSNYSSGNQADRFVHKLEAVLAKLIVKLNSNGLPCGLQNQKELWQEWLQMRGKLDSEFSGEWVDKILMRIDKKMLPSDSLPAHVTEDLFISEYFNKLLHMELSPSNLLVNRNIHAWLPFQIDLLENWKVEDKNGFYSIIISGKLRDMPTNKIRSWLEKSRIPNLSNEKIEVESKGIFDIDLKTGWCSAYQTTYILKVQDIYLREMKNKLISRSI